MSCDRVCDWLTFGLREDVWPATANNDMMETQTDVAWDSESRARACDRIGCYKRGVSKPIRSKADDFVIRVRTCPRPRNLMKVLSFSLHATLSDVIIKILPC